MVEWFTQYEDSVFTYRVEHSSNGTDFTPLAAEAALNNNGGSATYIYQDRDASAEENFYRVKGIKMNGTQILTSIVRVGPLSEQPDIRLTSNPLIGNRLELGFSNLTGVYKYRIINSGAQLITSGNINIENGNFNKTIFLPSSAPGSYVLQLSDNAEKTTSITFIIN